MPIFWSGFHLTVSWTTGNVNANAENHMSLVQLEAEILHFKVLDWLPWKQ